jgi:Xaa-Pro aminopeptidase
MVPVPIDGERRAKVIASLRSAGLDAVLCSSATGVLLLSQYWPVMSESLAIVTADGSSQLIIPKDEHGLASHSSHDPITVYKPAGLDSLCSPLERVRDPLREAIQQLGLSGAKIGIETGLEVQPSSYAVATDFHTSIQKLVKEVAPGVTLIGCDDLIERLKAVKTSRELEIMQHAADVAEAGFKHAQKAIEHGLRETEIAARIQAAFEACTEAKYFQRSYGYFFCMSGPNSAKAAAAYARTRQRVVEAGDLVMIHANTCGDGYWTDITRTYVAGAEESERQKLLRSVLAEARQAAFEAIRPGARASDVDHAARGVMKAHGLGEAFKHATGHGVGFVAANPNGLPRIHPLSPDVLEEGMTFNVEPAAYFDGYGGMRHCDLVAVTSTGVRVLTNF